MQTGEQVGLYLSVPFCRSKCSFCNFASGVYPSSELPRYVERLVADLDSAHQWASTRSLVLPERVDTVYLGGGTPSILSPAQLRQIFAALRNHFTIEPDAEITLEAAPAMLGDDLLAAAAELGVTRVSFGVQTFVDAEARAVGRLHTAAQALADVGRAREAGMAVSLDLIAGLPGQTAESWRRSVETLVEAAPEHASVYMLEVDEDSRLGGEMMLGGTRYGAALTPSDDAVADFYAEALEMLAGGGLAQYEISNFARQGLASRHNLRYWHRRPYLGLGLDAHSMLRSRAGEAVRFGTGDDLRRWMDQEPSPGNGFGESNRLTRGEELEEAWFLGLRCNAGVSLADLRQEFAGIASPGEPSGLSQAGPSAPSPCRPPSTSVEADPLEPFLPVLADLVRDGLLTLTGAAWELTATLTSRGRLLSNEVFARFLRVAEEQESAVLAASTR